MKRILLVLSLVGGNLALASDMVKVVSVGGKFLAVPVSFNDYVRTVDELPSVISGLRGSSMDEPFFEDLSNRAVRQHGGWGWYLSDLLNERRNTDRLKVGRGRKNPIRERNRQLLNDFIRPINHGLQLSDDLENVAVVEYLLNKLVNDHAYSYEKMNKMSMDDKMSKLLEIMIGYIATLNDLEKPN